MPKLPEFIFDSHKRYKADTNQLTAWLVETAQGLGYGSEPSSVSYGGESPHAGSKGGLKGKLRKQAPAHQTPAAASPVADYRNIFVNEFTKLARFIADMYPRIKVPNFVLKLARSAIAVRKRCAQWFQRRTSPEGDTSGDTHWHFITVLEQVVQILDPLCERDGATKSATVETRPPKGATAAVLVNPFSLLDIEEPEDGETITPAVVPNASLRRQVVVYTVVDDDSDTWFALFCFFEDLHDIREFLRATWIDYRDRKIDLITASVTTNMAFNVIRSAGEELLALHPGLDSYKKVATVLCFAACISRGGDPKQMKLGDVRNHLTIDVEEFVYVPIYSLLLSLRDVIQPNHLPVYKPGHFGTYDPLQPRDALSLGDQRHEDCIILSEMLPDFISLARLQGDRRPVEDEFTEELQNLVRAKEISLLLVFATQVYLDIHHVLREQVDRGFTDLRSAGVMVDMSLRRYKQNSPKVDFENWCASNELVLDSLHSFTKEWILKDALGAIKQPVVSRLLPGVPSEGYFLLTRHPLLCGMIQFRLHLLFQQTGLTLATAWGTVMYVSHLYEAGKHAGLLGADSWKDIEWVMKVHDKERIFRGRVPQTVTESYKSLTLMAGVSTSHFAFTGRRHNPRKHSPKGPSFLKENSPVSAMFLDGIVHGGVTLTTETMEELLADVGVDPGSLQQYLLSERQTKLQQQWAKSHKMTPLQFLAALRAALVTEQHVIRFDYVSLHMRCIKLLREIKARLHDQFVRSYGEGYFESEKQLSWLVVWILQSATESDAVRNATKRRAESSSSNGLLGPACLVVDEIVMREGGSECAKVEKVLQQ